jgi:hypothetical protein
MMDIYQPSNIKKPKVRYDEEGKKIIYASERRTMPHADKNFGNIARDVREGNFEPDIDLSDAADAKFRVEDEARRYMDSEEFQTLTPEAQQHYRELVDEKLGQIEEPRSETKLSPMGPEKIRPKVPWPDFEIGPETHGHAELADAIKAARILLRHGIDPQLPVTVKAAYIEHGEAGAGAQFPWTLGMLGDHEPVQISPTRFRDEATPKGVELYPDGKRMIVRAADGSWERKFDSHLAAARFVDKMTANPLDRPIDDPFEQVLGIGKHRSFDADIDANHFQRVDLQELATKELIAGKRPMIVLHGNDEEAIKRGIRAVEILNSPGAAALMQTGTPAAEIARAAGVTMPKQHVVIKLEGMRSPYTMKMRFGRSSERMRRALLALGSSLCTHRG